MENSHEKTINGHLVKPRFLRLAEVVYRTGLSRSSIYDEIAKGEFPGNRKLSARSVGWIESEVEAWIARRMNIQADST